MGPPTCSCDGLLILVFIALIEVVQVADVCGFDAHQAGQTLHVFITEEEGHEKKHLPFPRDSLMTSPQTGNSPYDK